VSTLDGMSSEDDAESPQSSADAYVDDCDFLHEEADSLEEELHVANVNGPAFGSASNSIRQLADMVARECAFLKINDWSCYTEKRPNAQKDGVRDCLMFYVHGLPKRKRVKWSTPLFFAVKAILERHCHVEATISKSTLFVRPNACHPFVRLDFASAR
jgi:hypothetical protein